MENVMSIEEAVKLYGESVFGENDDISETIESFPVKDRTSKSSRRKKTYFKGKKRYDRVYQKGFTPFPEKENRIKGMLRNTNVITANYNPDPYYETDISAVRRDLDASELIKDYYEEVV